MDWTVRIEEHRQALKGILVTLAAMVAEALVLPACAQKTLPRHLHRAVLSLLRPAEAAARRLAIALARGLVHTPAPRMTAPPKPRPSIFVREGVGTGIVWKGGGPLAHLAPARAASRALSLPLLDPLPRWTGGSRPWKTPSGLPRISLFDAAARQKIPAWRPPLPDDQLDAARLGQRLAALSRALDDLPGLARRFVRWQARRDVALANGRTHRVAPLRGGRPPGGRLACYHPDARRLRRVREVDKILAHAHALAHNAPSRRGPDTS